MKRKNILHIVFAKRFAVFLGISAAFSAIFLAYLVPSLVSILTSQHVKTEWLWICTFYFILLCNTCLGIWVVSDSTDIHLPAMRPFKHAVNSLTMGPPMGYCLVKCFDGGMFFTPGAPGVCSVAASLCLLLLNADLEERLVQLGPSASPPFTLLPSRRGDISDGVHTVLFAVIFSAVYSYGVCLNISSDVIICAGIVALTLVVLRLGLDSLLVNIAVYPIDFEKLTPSAFSGEISSAKFQIFHGNYFHAVQNFSLVFLLNNLNESLAIDGISYNDFLHSFDCGSSSLNQQVIFLRQQQFIDRLYESTQNLMATVRYPGAHALLSLGAPRPLATTTVDPSRALDGSSRFCGSVRSQRSPVNPSFSHVSCWRSSLFSRVCRSLALRDLCRLARVSPLRRALIYRNPVLLQQAMYTLCSLVEFHAAQVHLCSAWIIAEEERRATPICRVRASLDSFLKSLLSSFQEQHGYSISDSSEPSDYAVNVGGVGNAAGVVRGKDVGLSGSQSGHHAIRAQSVVRNLCLTRSRSAVVCAWSSCMRFLSSLVSCGIHRFSPLSRREMLDVANTVDALSALLVKSLNEDASGQTCNYFPSSLCAFLNMSSAINTYVEVVNGSSSSKASYVKLNGKSKRSPKFKCGELRLLLLAVEESVVRVLRTNASVLSAIRSSSSALPIALQAELQRISSAL